MPVNVKSLNIVYFQNTFSCTSFYKVIQILLQCSPLAKTWSKTVVVLTQRSKHNEFVLLCKGKKQLCLKVLKGCCSEPDYPSVKRRNGKTCKHEDPDFEQLSEDNHFFIMHSEGESVKFQCYEDTNYFLHVNDDSLDIRKPDHKDPNGEKNFFFRVSYL